MTIYGKIMKEGFTATLTDTGWRSTSREVASFLNEFYRIQDYSPSDGAPGVALLEEAARNLGCKVQINPQPESRAGAIY